MKCSISDLNFEFLNSFGSLVADYAITFDQQTNVASLEKNITDALKTISPFEKTIGERTFSGEINATRSITGNSTLKNLFDSKRLFADVPQNR